MNSPDTQTTRIALALLALASCLFLLPARAQAANGPFNGKIAFQSFRDGNGELYTMNPNGTGQVNITNNPAKDGNPAWSPDGTKIAFDTNRDGGKIEVYVMTADGSNPTRLTFTGFNFGPAWSPDGTKLAFVSRRDGNAEIYTMNSDGTGQTRLTIGSGGADQDPAWSPDGTKIAFVSDRAGGSNQIYVMNVNGTGVTRLTNNPTVPDAVPSFSPDGTKIVFQRQLQGPQIVVMNATGSSQTPLTSFSSNGQNFDPVFSPDGKRITFHSDRDNNLEIYSMNADGSNQVLVSNNSASDNDPTWQLVAKADTIGVFRPSTGQFFLRNSNTAGSPDRTISFGQAGDQPLAGDWNGDGLDDVGVFRNGQFRLRQPVLFNGQPTNIASTLVINFGQAGDLAVVGDWNNDGIDTPGVFRPSTGQFLLTNSPNTSNSSPSASIVSFSGQAGDQPVAGDWNGDGIDSIGVYREAAACSFFLSNHNSTTDIIAANFCGASPVSPLVGDWNGNGVDTIGIHSGSLAAFSLSNSNTTLSGSAEIQVAFGQAGDLPVAGDWNGGATP